jgi:hypothetical protein
VPATVWNGTSAASASDTRRRIWSGVAVGIAMITRSARYSSTTAGSVAGGPTTGMPATVVPCFAGASSTNATGDSRDHGALSACRASEAPAPPAPTITTRRWFSRRASVRSCQRRATRRAPPSASTDHVHSEMRISSDTECVP